jgi:hypothetical protein
MRRERLAAARQWACVCTAAALALLCAAGSAFAQNPRLNLLKNSGFELSEEGKPAEWTLSDAMSSISSERAHAGKQSLKVVDADDKKGSNVLGPVFSVIPKREYFLKGWAYLQEGSQKNPLGIYLWSLDEQGKEIKGPDGKQSFTMPRLSEGRWVHFFQPVTVFDGAKKVRLVLHTFDAAKGTVFVDDVELLECFPGIFGDTSAWRGGSPDNLVRHAADYSLRWSCADAEQVNREFNPPLDWSKYSGVSVWLHANQALGNSFILVLSSENPKSEGADYYSTIIPVEWSGWKQFIFAFKDLRKARSPLGFGRIERIFCAATGWDMTFNPDLVIHNEDLKPVNVSQ